MSIFEMIMLICFGAAWPISLYKSITSKSVAGKSVLFMFVIFAGYISGIIHKIVFNPDMVIILYILNAVMVGLDIAFYYRNVRLSKVEETATSSAVLK